MAPSNLPALTVIDGGLSTELERLGATIAGELWTGQTLLTNPELIEQAHRNYVEAGAQVVITSSYQLSRRGFIEIGLTAAEADEALGKSVEVARAAVAGTAAKVAASVGPFGAVLHDGSEYRGDYTASQAELEEFHRERIAVLVSAKPDYLAIETIPNLLEAKALANVLTEFDTPRWISFTAADSQKLWSGELFADAVEAVASIPNLIAVGVNCVSPEHVEGLATTVTRVAGAPVIAYPNRGGTWDSAAGVWVGVEPAELVDYLPSWAASGVALVGGCCGTDSRDIAKLSQHFH